MQRVSLSALFTHRAFHFFNDLLLLPDFKRPSRIIFKVHSRHAIELSCLFLVSFNYPRLSQIVVILTIIAVNVHCLLKDADGIIRLF
jgi:hypothetical protein